MQRLRFSSTWLATLCAFGACAADLPPAFPLDPQQDLERTCFQTAEAWSPNGNLRSDVAMVYGIDAGLPERIDTWRKRGYRIHVMTGVSWGNYQDYLYGRFDGINHEDEAQTDRNGNKVSHGGDVYYMCPGTNFGKFLSVGVQRALDAGAEAIHLEEPEFWVRSGYSEGFKREWRSYYNEDWAPPHSSVDAQWRSSKLKYFLYRRALQQVFDYVQEYNKKTGRKVRCYVPTHSLINYAQWGIVSPESSLARLKGCDGYIAQVWTGTSRSSNFYRGKEKERTFETAFLEYGSMQNLVRSTGRTVWYLNDPIEDNPNHDWEDYRMNWESTLVASLLQPEVWQFEVAPWPERIFRGRYPRKDPHPIPAPYATEVQTVMNTLNDMRQPKVSWDCGTTGLGVFVSDSLMFHRGDPTPSDAYLGNFYGLAMPLLKRGMPLAPVQLENVTVKDYLKGFRVLLLSYQGMKPLSPDVHQPIADWVRKGGLLVMCDDDRDPYNKVRDWWNADGLQYATPREHLFETLGVKDSARVSSEQVLPIGKGGLIWLKESPANIARDSKGDQRVIKVVKAAADHSRLKWKESNSIVLRRGPYVVASGMDESVDGPAKVIEGKFVSLFDPELQLQKSVELKPATRVFLLDLNQLKLKRPQVLASACKTLPKKSGKGSYVWTIEGVGRTQGIILMHVPSQPKSVSLAGAPLDFEFSKNEKLLWLRFKNESHPRELQLDL